MTTPAGRFKAMLEPKVPNRRPQKSSWLRLPTIKYMLIRGFGEGSSSLAHEFTQRSSTE